MKQYDFAEVEIDLHPLDHETVGNLDSGVLKQIEEACRESGVFYVTAPGIDSDFVDGLFEETKAFFDRPDDEKLKSAADYDNYYMGFRPVGSEKSVSADEYESCEQYKLGYVKDQDGTSYSNVSERLSSSEFQSHTEYFWNSAQEISERLQQYFAVILGFEPDYFDQFMAFPLHNLGLNYYPADSGARRRLHAHVDYSLFTMLIQESEGLMVEPRQGGWLDAPVRKGRLLVMVGEYLHRWSREALWAPPHCVRGTLSKKRYAIVYKQRPGFETVISIPGTPEVHLGRLYEEKLKSIVGGFP